MFLLAVALVVGLLALGAWLGWVAGLILIASHILAPCGLAAAILFGVLLVAGAMVIVIIEKC